MNGVKGLLDALPLCRDRPAIVPGAPAAFRYVDHDRPEFVEPPLSFDADDLRGSQAVVVSAPAAVGKSMLAEHLARRTGGILWDLSQARVGNTFALGTLAGVHGPHALGEVLASLQSGRFVVIADAVDEARLRVTFDAFTVFLDDLARQVLKGSDGSHPSFVLLARQETAELTAEWLRELDVRTAEARLDFFDRDDAMLFMSRQIERAGRDPTAGALPQARDLIVGHILELLGVPADAPVWPSDPARRFLGYAPVLVAASRYLLSGGNPQRIAEELKGTQAASAMWTFLLRLLDDMLARESDKFVRGFRDRVETKAQVLGFTDWQRLFLPAEQCAWLASETLRVEPPECALPPDLADDYRREVRGWLTEHPFFGASTGEFASPVFEDYVYAKVLLHGSRLARHTLRRRVAEVDYRPTEALARFFFALSRDDAMVVEDLPVLYESLIASDGGHVAISIVESDSGDGDHLAVLEIGDREPIVIELIADGEPIQFLSRLEHARILTSRCPVVLGASGRLLELGPDTTIYAPSVEIAAQSIMVQGSQEHDTVHVVTGRLFGSDPTLRFVRGAERFGVQATDPLRYPFADRSIDASWPELPLTRDEQAVAHALFRLAGLFKSEGYDGLGSYAEPVDRLTKNDTIADVFDAIVERNLITRSGSIYQFHPETIGLDYASVRSRTLSPEAHALVRDIASRRG